MKTANEQIEDYVRGHLELWAAEFIQDRIAGLRNRKATASGDLARSLEYEVQAQAANATISAILAFEDTGRFIDMRRLQPPPGGGDYLFNIIKWIIAKGLKEKMVRGYLRRRKLKKAPQRVMTYIAFGIVRKRHKGKYRRQRWYNKAKSASISRLFDDITIGMPDEILEQMKRELPKRIK